VEHLIDESKWLIEWTAGDADADQAATLIELQLLLAQWQRQWPQIWGTPGQRQYLNEQSAAWSERVLAMSGLLGCT